METQIARLIQALPRCTVETLEKVIRMHVVAIKTGSAPEVAITRFELMIEEWDRRFGNGSWMVTF